MTEDDIALLRNRDKHLRETNEAYNDHGGFQYSQSRQRNRSHLTFILTWICLCIAMAGGLFILRALDSSESTFRRSDNSEIIKINNAKNNTLTKKSMVNHGDDDWPRVAWLMSFPNSGTSYTLEVVHKVSNRSIGSNYHRLDFEDLNEEGRNVPFHPDHKDGPYLHEIYKQAPERYVLTKTHCDGKCTHCRPAKYIQSFESFREGCCSGTRTIRSSIDENDYKTESYTYDIGVVKKIVHLFRNPFDNIVSRFHNHYKKEVKSNNTDWLHNHPRNSTGFHAWCDDMDAQYSDEEPKYYGEHTSNVSKTVPCHSDFYRYIQWHNRTFEVAKFLNVPVHILHYEDYYDNFNGTIQVLIDFLELEWVEMPSEFRWNNYDDHFTDEEKHATINWIKELASNETLNELMYYFDKF